MAYRKIAPITSSAMLPPMVMDNLLSPRAQPPRGAAARDNAFASACPPGIHQFPRARARLRVVGVVADRRRCGQRRPSGALPGSYARAIMDVRCPAVPEAADGLRDAGRPAPIRRPR